MHGARRHIALIGMMGSGKSTVGRELADMRGVRFVDTDDEIEARTGRTVRQLWDAGGEAAYRPIEREVVQAALASSDLVVVGVPGGVAVDDAMGATLVAADVTTVLLRARVDTLVEHLEGEPERRPLIGDDPTEALARLWSERADRYLDLADHVVDVDGNAPRVVAAHVACILDVP